MMTKPVLFQLVHREQFLAAASLAKKIDDQKKIDTVPDSLKELFKIRNPVSVRMSETEFKAKALVFAKSFLARRDMFRYGTCVYLPWSGQLMRVLEESEYQEVRTARNRNLITGYEQTLFYNTPVVIFGLSVGSHAAVTIAMQGGGRSMIISDFDTLSLPNLNRIRVGASSIGKKKSTIVAEEMYDINPYQQIDIIDTKIDDKFVDRYLEPLVKGGVIVEETDDLKFKILIRRKAKKRRIPVVMATDNGDGIILDVERFDLYPDLPIFYGKFDGIDTKNLMTADRKTMSKIIEKIMDPRLITPRMKLSTSEIGKTLYSWPQLGTAAQLAGSVISYAVRMIATGGPIHNGRSVISFEKLLSSNN